MLWGKSRLLDFAPSLSLPDLIKRTRIVVIDDVPGEFPFQVLKKLGYAIDHWPDIQNLQTLETGFYDIIVLDIGGIGHEFDAKNEGLAVLNHIKTVNPSQIVIAYSGQSYDASRISFFKLADQCVPKPTSAMTWKETLDDLIQNKVTLGHYWTCLSNLLQSQGYTEKQLARVEKRLVDVAKGKISGTSQLLSSTLNVADKMATVATIVGKIVILCTASP